MFTQIVVFLICFFFVSDYRSYGHGGGIYGYISDVFLLPDVKVGVFISTTNDAVSVSQSLTDVIAYHTLDLVLGENPWVDVDSACTIYPEAFSGRNHSDSFGSDNQTNYEYVCEDLIEEFSRYEGIYQSAVSGTLYVIPNKSTGFLEFKLGVSGHGRLCRTDPPIDASPDALRFYFEGVFEHYNSPALNSKFNATVIFHPPKGAGEVQSATLGFLENSVYHWIGPLPAPSTTTQMPTALPFIVQRSSANNCLTRNVFVFVLLILSLNCFLKRISTH